MKANPLAIERKNAPPAPNEAKAAIDKLTSTVETGLKALSGRIEAVEKIAARPRLGGNVSNTDPSALAAEFKALGGFVRTDDDTEFKAMSVGSNPDGGYLVHSALSKQMTTKLFDQSPIRGICRIETITDGDAFEEPVDNAEIGASWVSENASRPVTTTATLRMLRVPVHEIYALQQVTQRLLDDSGTDIGAWIEGKVSDKFGRSEGAACVSGDGINKPRGFMDHDKAATADDTRTWGALQYVVSGSASVVADADGGANGLKDLYWALRAPYRKNGTWVMASATANALDKLKDANKDYIWRDGMTAGAPPSLLGRPVEFDENMPTIGAGNYPVAFGDFKAGYMIVDKAGVRWLRDPFSSKPNVLIYAYRRTGGDVANSEAIKLLKIAAS